MVGLDGGRGKSVARSWHPSCIARGFEEGLLRMTECQVAGDRAALSNELPGVRVRIRAAARFRERGCD